MGFAGFSGRELDVIALLVNGVRPPEIARRIRISDQRVYFLLKGVYSKTGMRDVAELTAWAIECGLDEPLGPETAAERPYPGMPAPRREKIRQGRMRGTRTPRRETRIS